MPNKAKVASDLRKAARRLSQAQDSMADALSKARQHGSVNRELQGRIEAARRNALDVQSDVHSIIGDIDA